MIVGIGTDILEIKKILPENLRPGDPFLKRAYTEKEIMEASQSDHPYYYYADRFAGKEAVFKALRIPPHSVRLSDIEILNDPTGAPCLYLHGRLKDIAEQKHISTIHISLSYDDDYAIAFAVAESI